MDILDKLKQDVTRSQFLNSGDMYEELNNHRTEAAKEIENLRKEITFLKSIISEAIVEIEKPLNERETDEILLRMYGAIEEGTGDLFG